MINNDGYLSRRNEKWQSIAMGPFCSQFNTVKICSKFSSLLAIDGLVGQATIIEEKYIIY